MFLAPTIRIVNSPWSKAWAPRIVFVGALLLGARSANASDVSEADRARATELFREGRSLMAAKRYAEACPMLEESQRLDPGGGTLLNVALCHELQGRAATAWSEFNEAMTVARGDRRRDREVEAERHIRALEPHLARLTVEVPPEARVPNLVVRRDSAEVLPVAWGAGVPVDPGVHVVEAEAPGRSPWRATVAVSDDGSSQTVRVPVLEPLPPIPGLSSSTAPSSTPTAAPAVSPLVPAYHAPPARTEPSAPNRGPGWQRPLALGVGAVGVLALAVGTAYGLQAAGQWSDAQASCHDGVCTTSQAYASWQDSRRSASTATAAFAIAAVGVGGGIALWLTTPATTVRIDATLNGASARAEF
jgi:hypothetical protein